MDAQGQRISIYTSSGTFEPIVDLDGLQEMMAKHDHLVLNILNYCRALVPVEGDG